jgi:chloramphenicol-sensitive protein RarD
MLQFLTAVVVFHEPMRPVRWIGFFLVWMALVILSSDALTAARRNPRALRRS